MNNLFRKSNTNVGGYIPPTLVNLTLRGNKIMKFNVRRGTSLVPTSRNELILPYYECDNKYNEQVLLNTAITKMKLFRTMKFRTKELDILHIAQFLFANKYHKQGARKKANKIARAMGFPSHYEYDRYLTDAEEIRELTKNERKFLSLMYNSLGTMEQIQSDLIAKEVIKKILANESIQEVYKYYVKKTAFAGQPRLIDYDDVKSYIKSLLEIRYPVGSKLPNSVLEQDSNRVYDVLSSLFYGIHEAQYYITWSNFRGTWYYDRDVHHYRNKKMSTASIRRRVNKLVRLLTNPFEGVRNSYKLQKMLTSEGSIKLDGEEYLAQLEAMDKIADEYDDSITLPQGISEELAKQIMEDSEQQYERHFINYWGGDTSGMHGVAKIFKFTPTNTIHKAVREIAKRNSDRGVVPKNMHRMTTDKKVFANKTTVAGGSMMIDCSGSMSFYEEDIREIIDYLPASNIAGYVGYNTKIDGYDGMIKIIAKDGRIDTHAIRDLEEYGANSVDLDGLKWLAQQPEPRIWVSDQQVVGVDNNGTAVNLNKEKRDEIARFMRRHNIIPIRVVEQVKKLSKQLGTK